MLITTAILSVAPAATAVAPAPMDGFGQSIASIRFADPERSPWIAIGAPGVGVAERQCFGAIYAFGGEHHEPQWSARGNYLFGNVLAEIADLDGDGTSDLVARESEALVLLSGASGQRIGTIPTGRAGSDDGIDVLEGQDGPWIVAGDLGCVRCHSAHSRNVVWEYAASPSAEHGVECVCTMPDLDGDGVQEVVVGVDRMAMREGNLALVAEVVVLLSGATGRRIWGVSAPLGDRLGRSLAVCGDWNQDGFPDIVVGAPRLIQEHGGVMAGAGHAFVLSGRDGAILSWLFPKSPSVGFGYSCALLSVGDAKPARLLISAFEELGEDSLYECSAHDRKPRLVHAGGVFSDFGYRVEVIGDQDHDGQDDYAVASVYDDLDFAWDGKVTLFSGEDDRELCVLRRPAN